MGRADPLFKGLPLEALLILPNITILQDLAWFPAPFLRLLSPNSEVRHMPPPFPVFLSISSIICLCFLRERGSHKLQFKLLHFTLLGPQNNDDSVFGLSLGYQNQIIARWGGGVILIDT